MTAAPVFVRLHGTRNLSKLTEAERLSCPASTYFQGLLVLLIAFDMD